jgi:hypothetical protein
MQIDFNGNWFSGICLLIAGHILAAIYTPEATRRHLAKIASSFAKRRSVSIPTQVSATSSLRPSATADLVAGSISSELDGLSSALVGTSLPPPRRPVFFPTTDDHYAVSNALIQSRRIAHIASGQIESYRNNPLLDSTSVNPPN